MDIQEVNKLILEAQDNFQAEQYDIAQLPLQKVLRSYPRHSRANELLAYIKGNLGDNNLSHELLKIACEDPNCTPQALYYLGSSYLQLNVPDNAIRFLKASINKGGNFFEGLHDLATAQAMVKQEKEAIENFKKAASLNPRSHEVFYNLGKVYDSIGDCNEAIRNYEIAINIYPDFAQAHFNKAGALNELGRYEQALMEYECAQKLMPNMELLWGNLIHAEMKICAWNNLKNHIDELNEVVNNINYLATESTISISESEEQNFKVAYKFANTKFPEKNLSKRERVNKNSKIHIGYFSADFHNHATAFLMAEIFELHDKNRFHITAFSFGPVVNDGMRNRLRIAFDEFIEVNDKSDEDIANLSQDLGIDIAIDLKGYTQHGRSNIFSYRAAPIQISYLGYPGTLGVPYMDYIIADPTVIPECNREFYSEKVIYLPNCYQANDSKRVVSSRIFHKTEMGLPEVGFVFCCFNNNYKITPHVFDGWMQILHKVDGSVLWLLEDSATAVANLKREALVRGIPSNRLVFAKKMPLADHLARHQLADLFLDTLPYNAHTTASDALWAGLPVLTCLGNTFPGRVAASLLKAVGLEELIAHSQEEYIDLAINLANEPERLGGIRNNLAKNRLITPLFNSTLFTRHIESAYQQAYDRYHAGLSPDHLYIT